MSKTSRKNKNSKKNIKGRSIYNFSRKNKNSKRNVKQRSRKNKINKIRGGENTNDIQSIIDSIKAGTYTNTTLDLSNSNIDYKLAKKLAIALQKNKTITSLNLSGNNIDSIGIGALSTSLKSNETITYLDLSNNNLSDSSAFLLADLLRHGLCSVSICNKTLTTLILSNNKIGTQGAISLKEVLLLNNNITELKLDNNPEIPNNTLFDIKEKLEFNIKKTSPSRHVNSETGVVYVNASE